MSNKSKMNFKIGPPATKSNYFPRPDVTNELKDAMEQGHALFLSPRRTGKTSILLDMQSEIDNERDIFFINLEKYTTPEQWVAAMIECLLKHRKFHSTIKSMGRAYGKIADLLNRVESINYTELGVTIRESVAKDWQKTAEDFLRKLIKTEHSVWFLLDEFPILVKQVGKHGGDVENMLRWFRDWRLDCGTERIKFLVTGSIGLDGVVKKMGLADTVNDFDSIILPPLSEKQAFEFMDRLSKDNEFNLPLKIRKRIVELLGPPWPYFLQIFLSEIKAWLKREKRGLTIKTLDQIYHERMVAGAKNKYPSHMYGRLKEIFSTDELRFARALLKECAKRADGLMNSDILNVYHGVVKDELLRDEEDMSYVLDVLKHDGYLAQDFHGDQKTRFFSNLLRDYWKRRAV